MVAPSGTKAEILPAIPSNRNMIFPGDHTCQKSLASRYKHISRNTREIKLNGLIHTFENFLSSSSNDIGYTKLIEMDIETDPNLPPTDS